MSWEQLRSITRQNREYHEFWRKQPPRACPNDGTPLNSSPPDSDSELYCPHDGWKYPRDWDPTTMAGF